MAVINLTPHSVEVFNADQFINLEQTNPTTWVADGVNGDPIKSYPSSGMLRISTSTIDANPVDGIPAVATSYGELTGVPARSKHGQGC